MGNLAVFCFWSVAKPNYYVPCLPGMALLIGATWVELAQAARAGEAALSIAARGLLQTQWVLLVRGGGRWHRSSCGIGFPRISGRGAWPSRSALAVAVALSVHAWRKGATASALAPLTTACVIGFLVAYGRIAPAGKPPAQPPSAGRAGSGKSCRPACPRSCSSTRSTKGSGFTPTASSWRRCPDSHPRYNTAFDLAHSYLTERHHSETLSELEAKRLAHDKQALFDWLDRRDPHTPYLLIRSRLYDLFADDLAGRVETRAPRNGHETQRAGPARGHRDQLVRRVAPCGAWHAGGS